MWYDLLDTQFNGLYILFYIHNYGLFYIIMFLEQQSIRKRKDVYLFMRIFMQVILLS